jgi:hypothetical protein
MKMGFPKRSGKRRTYEPDGLAEFRRGVNAAVEKMEEQGRLHKWPKAMNKIRKRKKTSAQ